MLRSRVTEHKVCVVTLFYFTWLEPLRGTLQEDALVPGNWQEIQLSPKWSGWLGYAFESICYKHLDLIRKKLAISPSAIANTWRYAPRVKEENGAQIDLLFDRMDDVITLCEIKYSKDPYVINKAYARNLLNKQQVFVKQTRTKKQIDIAMITASGLADNLYSDDLVSGVVTLDDLFA